MANSNNKECNNRPNMSHTDPDLEKLTKRLAQNVARNTFIQETLDNIRGYIRSERVVLYYFYREWKGQVTFESLSDEELSIYGSTGADECFNDEYAAMYQEGRVRVIEDIELEAIHPCHRDFLRSIRVKANLVVPILNSRRLWGLLVAHQCQDARSWSKSDIEIMQKAAVSLATAPAIRDS
ncbi:MULTISPECIES: GAF domain-containing protein [Okeania]|uniref:GAF domain-containing protein n=1 Tax=Okeania hirsuta TaxID=1458930 RepID=A0A3N6PFD4_9CYAN|nr:GAF domain-containing protein [Okeania sp. SIO4D6]NEP75501.1 GAF domain-containing protein [Okeania sp. SIO2G5]NEP96622.1 GAF domain-containing protein [Okeania sp. SIO2F5]NEQ94348.1 GAF domain-containing protein [Okeania sp. SIO2G4]NES74757.1 GAF domain-containing protein [Okeania sp. SIO1H4]NES92439.1 GAF domain-containing protein [Okeania sp. SIO2B9]NET11839.1 GAF domain-containing protein [Okeania sp. SIO1H6]NET18480.1 GAF domain-containing protein [Okeania sp. SIO1H5]NET78871.1 GAF 